MSILAGGCRTTNVVEDSSHIVVTEVYIITGEEIVVTRVIELTPTPTPAPTAVPAEARGPVTLDISFVRDTVPAIDPQQNVSQDSVDLIENLFVGLTRFNHKTNRIEPLLAKTWEISENGRVWTFNLRDDIFWVKPLNTMVDGLYDVEAVRPVTAGDVVFAIQRACNSKPNTPDAFTLFIIRGCEQVNTTPNATLADLERIGVTALNDTTLQFTLTKPAAHFLTLTSLWFMRPLPPELIEAHGDDWQSETEAEWMTSGPFFPLTPELKTLQINPLWPLPVSGNIDQVNILYIPTAKDALALWQGRQIDLVDATNVDVNLADERIVNKLQLVPQQTLYYLGFNFDSGVFREPGIRSAFAAAIDRDKLAEELFGIQATGLRHLIPPGAVGSLPAGEVGQGYSPDYARQQLAASGFGGCRLMPQITFLVSSSDLSLQQAELIQRMWIDELNCTEDQIKIEQVQFGTLLANTRRGGGDVRPDVWELAWASYYPDAHNWMGDLLHCEDSENRVNRPCSAEDDLIRQANATFDEGERTAIYHQLENRFFSEGGIMPLAPLYIRNERRLVQTWLGYTPALFGGEQYDTYLIDADRKVLEQSR